MTEAQMLLAAMTLEDWKNFFELLFYIVAIMSAGWAIITYRQNSRFERARWLSTLYDKFYEGETLKKVRRILDSPADSPEVNQLALQAEDDFTDYLNFFEYVLYLRESQQLRGPDVETLFGYYFECLKRHERVRSYIRDPANDYQTLRRFLFRGAS
jgi:hypothetical protein